MTDTDKRLGTINLILPEVYKKTLTAYAKEHHYSMTYILRAMVKEFFAKKGVDLP